ncbi:MAG: hypothetical protein KDK99_06125 [Verrucomicrobiales bacterium]|nr:hypothetical protein [Verrucomicrobiales bacterium]
MNLFYRCLACVLALCTLPVFAQTEDVETPEDALPEVAPEVAPEEPAEIGEDGAVPQPYPITRYQSQWDWNPFAVETVPVAQPRENFAKDWALAALSRYQGVYTVILENKQTRESKRLKEGDDSGDMRIVSVHYDKDRTKSTVEVAMGGEVATLGVDESLARQVTISNTQGQPGQQGGTPGAGGVDPQGGTPAGRMNAALQAQLRRQQAMAAGQGVPAGGELAAGSGGQPGRPTPAGTSFVPGVGRVPTQNQATSVGGTSPTVVTPGAVQSTSPVPGATNVQVNPGTSPIVNNPNQVPGTTTPQPVSRRRMLIPSPVLRN